MLGSNSKYFHKSSEELMLDKLKVNTLLLIKGYNQNQVDIYLKAFDYFTENPSGFDGATIVKDLIDIPGLDLDAMLHDYHYIQYNVASSFLVKFKADWIYAKGQEKKGKGQYSAFSRFIGLTIIDLPLILYKIIKDGFISKENKQNLLNEYKILIG